MGYYVQGPATGKAEHLIKTEGALKIATPRSFDEVPKDKALVVVVENGFFDAAAFAYNKEEFEAFFEPSDYRRKTCLLMPLDRVKELSGYHK